LIAKYPNSEYAQDVVAGVSYLTAIKKGEIKPGQEVPEEYYKAPAVDLEELSNREVLTPAEKNPNLLKDGSFNPLDIVTDPGKALNNLINTFKKTGDELKNTVEEKFDEVKENVKDPSKLINNVNINVPGAELIDKKIINKSDSTNTKKPKETEQKDKPPK